MALVACSGQLLLQKKNHPKELNNLPQIFKILFLQKKKKKSQKQSHTYTQTNTLTCAHTHSSRHAHSRDVHTCIHTHTHTHPHSHAHTLACSLTHTHPREARRLPGPAAKSRLAFQGSEKEVVRLPKGQSSRILPPLGTSSLMSSEDQSQECEMEVFLLQCLSSGESRAGLLALQGWLSSPQPPSSLDSASRIL